MFLVGRPIWLSLVLSACTFGATLPNAKDNAIVTLVMGERSGYSAGAIALGQSLVDVGSKISRIALVTPEVEEFNRKSLSKLWTVIEVEPIYCNHKLDPSITEHEYDLKGEQYLAGIQRWSATCTKFAAWKLIQFKRLVFFDSDMIALQPVDDVLYGFTNASFAAAPETFPPDTFNSGVMVLNPSLDTFEHLLELNEQVGSAEGGDQGVFNNGLCPNWYTAAPDDPHCGKIPWLFNVEAVHFAQYQTLRKMSGLRLPAMGHFVSDGKPWKVVAMEYMKVAIPPETQTELMKQKFLHVYWRLEFFKASGDAPPAVSFFGAEVDTLFSKTWRGDATSRSNLIDRLGLLDSGDDKANGDNVRGKGMRTAGRMQLDPVVEEQIETEENERQIKPQAKAKPKAKVKAKAKAKPKAKRRPLSAPES